jgi:transcriptional regulator with XRE-family HTH domain
MDLNSPGSRLSIYRKSLKLSQEEMGERLGLNKTQIRDMESGKVKISESRANLLHDRFGLKKDWLLRGQDEMNTTPTPKGEDDAMKDKVILLQDKLLEAYEKISTLEKRLAEKDGVQRERESDAAL